METIKEPKHVDGKADGRELEIADILRDKFDSLSNHPYYLLQDAVEAIMALYTTECSETIELYNRQCERANELQEENNRLKERVQELKDVLTKLHSNCLYKLSEDDYRVTHVDHKLFSVVENTLKKH